MNFVNIHGEKINFDPNSSSYKSPPKVSQAAQEKWHGFRVVGYSPKRIEEAVEANKRLRKMAEESGGAPIPDFNLGDWMHKNKPMAATPGLYAIKESAELCAELLRKEGWLYVQVIERITGRK